MKTLQCERKRKGMTRRLWQIINNSNKGLKVKKLRDGVSTGKAIEIDNQPRSLGAVFYGW